MKERGEDGVSVYLPISQTFDGNQTERVVYQLTALEANAPMPEGSAGGYDLTELFWYQSYA